MAKKKKVYFILGVDVTVIWENGPVLVQPWHWILITRRDNR